MNVVNSHKSLQDSDKFIEKTNDDVNEWMDSFYVDGRSAPFNLHCLWAWQEQERRHSAIEAELLEALQKIQFRCECFIDDGRSMKVPSVEAINAICQEAIAKALA